MDSQQRHPDPYPGVCENACGHRHNTQSSWASTRRHRHHPRGGDGVDACPGRDLCRHGRGLGPYPYLAPSHGRGRGRDPPDIVSRPPPHHEDLDGVNGGRVSGPLPPRQAPFRIPCVSFLERWVVSYFHFPRLCEAKTREVQGEESCGRAQQNREK